MHGVRHGIRLHDPGTAEGCGLCNFTTLRNIRALMIDAFVCCRGISFDKLGRFEDAVADFSEVLRLEPLNVNAYFNRSVLTSTSDTPVQMPKP